MIINNLEKNAVFQKDNPDEGAENALDNDAFVCKQLAQASIMANKQMVLVYDLSVDIGFKTAFQGKSKKMNSY